jgi:hydroxymethylbilane synthase
MTSPIRFGTRGSDLALWQTRHVMALLQAALPGQTVEYEIISTRGDQVLDTPLPLIGGKGVFTAELESALHEKRIDCAVHSLKDLPVEPPAGLVIGAIPPRENPADVLISRSEYTLKTLPRGARVGTSSTRRAAQLLHRRPDLRMLDLRGNVNTRIRKALASDGDYDAIILAYAGVERLNMGGVISQVLDTEIMLPAPGQGAIAAQTRDDPALRDTFARINEASAALAVTAERAFLAGMGGGCSVPVAAYGRFDGPSLQLRGRITAPDGSRQIDVERHAPVGNVGAAVDLGTALAQRALEEGALSLLGRQP